MARTTIFAVLLFVALPAASASAGAPAHGQGQGHNHAQGHEQAQIPSHAQVPPDASEQGAVGNGAPLWTKDEMDTARAQCNALLATVSAVTTPVEPLRQGECGAPAPVEVISIGSNPQVTLSTPVVMTCAMVVGLHKWLKSDVQPAAREILGSPVVRLEVMSSYSCRNAYGRKKTRLSEHGRANAVDIGAFMTQQGESVDVLTYWGPTERELRAQIAASAAAAKAQAAKAEEIKKQAERMQATLDAQKAADAAKSVAEKAGEKSAVPPAPRVVQGYQREMSAPGLRGSVVDPGSGSSAGSSAVLGLAPSHLGGPKPKKVATGSIDRALSERKQSFLRRVHAAGCKTFGTILGPEANAAHRNHFHLDMAERKTGNYCE